MMTPIHLEAGELRLTVLPVGAAIQSLHLAGVPHSLILGHKDPETYRTAKGYLGVIAGRFANRIAGGRVLLDGVVHELDRNDGANTLHGGTDGFSRREWEVVDVAADAVTLALTSPDGDQGFPGTLRATCRYKLQAPSTVILELTATTDRPTVVNLAQHAYWNLSHGRTIDDHQLHVLAEQVLATDDALIPTGIAPAPTLGVLHDHVLDTNFCLAGNRREQPEPAAALSAGKLRLEIATTEPGLQFYTGERLPPPFRAREGLCLEAQAWPNAPNRPDFPSARLDPGETYRQRTIWTLSRTT